jgi:hypothetical protein
MKPMILAAAVVLCLAGCSASPAVNDSPAGPVPTVAAVTPSAPPTEPSGPGTYVGGFSGALVDVEIPATADAETAWVLKRLGVKAGSFVRVTVDNRQGTRGTSVGNVGLSTADGERVEYAPADALIKGISSDGVSTEDYNRIVKWRDAAGSYTELGEKRTVLLASTKPMPVFVRADIGGNTIDGAAKLSKQ